MTSYVFPPPMTNSIPVSGRNERFPVGRVFCVGRNYAEHAREMGNDPDREPPFFFMKPAHSVVPAVGTIPYPSATGDLHHEIEMVVALGAGGGDVPPAQALSLVWGYGAGVDLTRRDLQAEAKALRRPWDFAKGFEAAAPCGALRPASEIGHPHRGRLVLEVNGEVRQAGDLDQMIWSVADIISHISRFMPLYAGDIIFSGTPAGVGALRPGDSVRGGVAGVGDFDFSIGPARS